MSRVHVAWFGATDFRAAKGEPLLGVGPVAQALDKRSFDQVVLITNSEKSDVEIVATFVPSLVRQAGAERESLRDAGRLNDPSFADVNGRSPPMKQMLARAQQAAPYDAPFSIEGESGQVWN